MYQCFVSNEWEQIQSTSELQLGGNLFQICVCMVCSQKIKKTVWSLFFVLLVAKTLLLNMSSVTWVCAV